MLDYKSPTTLEMPPVESILVETLDPEGPYGAKECGQGPLLPVIPAVANAVYDALGVRIDEVPITPEKVLAALEGRYRAPQMPDVRLPGDGRSCRRSTRGGPGRRRRTRIRRCGHEAPRCCGCRRSAIVAPQHARARPRASSPTTAPTPWRWRAAPTSTRT